MKVTSYAVARPAYYDRQATSFAAAYDAASVGPHGSTARISATVAAGNKTLIEAVVMYVTRETVATVRANQSVVSYAITTPANVPLTRTQQVTNVAGTTAGDQSQAAFTLYAGEQYQAFTFDLGTDGLGTYTIGVKGTTFQA